MTTRKARVGRWLANPRTGMAIALSLLAGVMAAFVISSGVTAHDALATRNLTATAASRRIDKLNDRIEYLSTSVNNGSEQIGALTAQVAALQAQVEQQGNTPVVPRATTTTTRPRTTTTTRPRTTSTTSPRPTTTTTTRPCTVSVSGRCLTGG